MNDIISQFTNHLKSALTRALCLVVETKHETIEPIHLLWSITTQNGCVASEIMHESGADLAVLKKLAGDQGKTPEQPTSHAQNFIPVLSEDAKLVLEKAVHVAYLHENKYIGTEHVLLGLMNSSSTLLQEFFSSQPEAKRSINEKLKKLFNRSGEEEPIKIDKDSLEKALKELDEASKSTDEDGAEKTPAIEYFTEELTHEDLVETFTPVIGREKEIERLTKVLTRKQKNNPMLIGLPGVGKTAIVEGLAKKIIEGDVPEPLRGKRILQLDLAAMIAGTMYRGEFESRLRQLIDEISDRPEVILFIDEAHIIMGAGATAGSLDAANILKPALARGDLRCIGATTSDEYKKFIEADGAMERRFQSVVVKEPSKKETIDILKGVKSYYEEFHRVTVSDAIIQQIVELADRYMPRATFPDKAIDILDESGAFAGMTRKQKKTNPLPELKATLARIEEKKKHAVEDEDFERAAEYKKEEAKLKKQIQAIKVRKNSIKRKTISERIILQTVSEMTNIPVKSLLTSEKRKLARLEKTLSKSVAGQEKTVTQVANAIKRAKVGLSDPEKPLCSFLFMGPSGVGKTHLAQTIAEELFESKNHFLRLDMSEYREPHTISKLIGSPAGYVGYREGTKLTDFVKEQPHSVVLFDELEKAHPDVHNLLLQILDEGTLTDATGRKINFRNTIIIATTNAGTENLKGSSLGFSDENLDTQDIRELLEGHFRTEILNRIQHICLFDQLNAQHFKHLAKQELDKLNHKLAEQNISCKIESTVSDWVAKQVKPSRGARHVSHIIEQVIEPALTDLLLEQHAPVKTVHISVKNNNVHVAS